MNPTENTESGKSAPLFKSTAFGRLLTRRNLILLAAVVIVLDIVLTHYFFNSRSRVLFRDQVAAAAAATGAAPVRLCDLTPFEWNHVEITHRENGGTRFWFSTYGTRTYFFDYVLDYEAGEIALDAQTGNVFTPDSRFTLERKESGITMLPLPTGN